MSRPQVGDRVRITQQHSDNKGKAGDTGELLQDDRSGVPYEVRLDSGDVSWCCDCERVDLYGGDEEDVNLFNYLAEQPKPII